MVTSVSGGYEGERKERECAGETAAMVKKQNIVLDVRGTKLMENNLHHWPTSFGKLHPVQCYELDHQS